MAKRKPRSASEAAGEPTGGGEPIEHFEDRLANVQRIVRRLESGEATIAESLRDYEAGIAELRRCHQLLESAEQRVDLLSGFDADGNPVTGPMPSLEKPQWGRTKVSRNQSTRRAGSPRGSSDQSPDKDAAEIDDDTQDDDTQDEGLF